LTVRSVSSGGSGSIGTLLGLSRIAGATAGETITVICLRGCSHRVLLTIPVGSSPAARVDLHRPIVLSTTTLIQINASARGRVSRELRYAFARNRSRLAVRLVQSGCLTAAGRVVACRA
jgi:hypothetical protein